ncbi:MAG: energy-coupling factor transporter transmembrane protein EcfT [Clostridia bacterium]|nr:energy-coupling factor transporter transmembrane protein EcfT [Clostridia bacterium]
MNEFKNYHPIVNLMYFIIVIIFACIFLHPVALAISLFVSFAYSTVLKGRHTLVRSIVHAVPMLIIMALINPAFNHQGVTIITYLPGGNPLTAESILYGFAAATMIVSVIMFFSCFNEVMTSDKFIYIFGRIIPSLSLVFSMVLRFVPKFIDDIKKVTDAQRCIGRDVSSGSLIKRAVSGMSVLSVMITQSLENSVDTSDAMKSRGYGLPGRTAFSIYRFTKRDIKALITILILSAYVITGKLQGVLKFECFPYVDTAKLNIYALSVFAAYFILSALPVFIELREVIKWKSIESKM